MEPSSLTNSNNIFFEGAYKEIWKQIFPEKITLAEVDFLEQIANLKKGNKVLDLMCGNGRHSIPLAKRGFVVTAIDNLSDYISEIKQTAKQENLPIHCIQGDVIGLELKDQFDLAISMGNSLSVFNYSDTMKLFSKVCSHLKKGAKFIIHTWMIGEIAVKDFKGKSWDNIAGYRYLSDSRYLFQPTRIESNCIIINEKNETEEKTLVEYIFSFAETEAMLNDTGFSISEVFSIPGKKKYSFGDLRAYIVAEKS